MKPRISMITLGVRDLERSIQFYEQGLGLPRMESPPEVPFFTLNGGCSRKRVRWMFLFSTISRSGRSTSVKQKL